MNLAEGLRFSSAFLDKAAARNDPKTPRGWHNRYAERVQRDFEQIKHWLPRDLQSVMDIGSGFAGIDALIARATGAKAIRLIDGDGTGQRVGGYSAAATAPWNDVALGAELVTDNVPGCEVTVAVVPPLPRPWPARLVLSLKSWGHHYPIAVYLDMVKASLMPKGILVVDLRVNSRGVGELTRAGFQLLGRAGGTAKADRMVFQA